MRKVVKRRPDSQRSDAATRLAQHMTELRRAADLAAEKLGVTLEGGVKLSRDVACLPKGAEFMDGASGSNGLETISYLKVRRADDTREESLMIMQSGAGQTVLRFESKFKPGGRREPRGRRASELHYSFEDKGECERRMSQVGRLLPDDAEVIDDDDNLSGRINFTGKPPSAEKVAKIISLMLEPAKSRQAAD